MRATWALAIVLAGCAAAPAQYQALVSLDALNARLAGRVVDFTANHGADRRIWSPLLDQPRDLYLYLPPGYRPECAYPLVLWLHGAFGDEHGFLGTARLECLDGLIRQGAVPPVIVAAPDLTPSGLNLVTSWHSFGIDSPGCGPFHTHLMAEVIPFVMSRYHVRPEREAHALVGLSAGGFGALNLALKHRDFFASAASLSGAINLRYSNVQNDYRADFSPLTYRWQTRYDRNTLVGSYVGGLVRLRAQDFLTAAFGDGPEVVEVARRENPADLLVTTNLQPGELDLLIAYGRQDELNMDAQAESFLWLAQCRGLTVDAMVDPAGGHTPGFFESILPAVYLWLGERL